MGIWCLDWLRLFWPSMTAYIFWPPWLILSSAMVISYVLPGSRAAAATQNIGQSWLGLLFFSGLIAAPLKLSLLILGSLKIISTPIQPSALIILGSATFTFSLGICLYGAVHARRIKIKNYRLALKKGDGKLDNIRIALISDLHIGYTIGYRQVKHMANAVNSLNADMVIIAGDFLNNDVREINSPEKMASTLSSIKAKYGVYLILGNHDIHDGAESLPLPTGHPLTLLCEQSGICLLQDESLLVADSFYFLGRMDASYKQRRPMAHLTSELNKNFPLIAADHQPRNLEEAAENGVCLQVSGHTHNGQFFPYNLLINPSFPCPYGYWQQANTQFIITSGIGYWGPPMRLGSDSEVVCLDISFK